jgi:hypothetical protein
VIVLPAGYGHWTDERRRVVLAHELAHIQRRDVLWQLVARLACILYWCHPLVWLANWRMRVEREFACDDAVLTMGEAPNDYASQLVDVAATLLATSKTPAHAVAMISRSSLERRVRLILQPCVKRTPVTTATARALTVGMLAGVIAVSLMSPSASQDVPATKSEVANSQEKKADSSTETTGQETQITEREASAKEPAAATTVVSGEVVDEQGLPAAGAVVSFYYLDKKLSTSADAQGRFQIAVPNDRLRGGILIAAGPAGLLGYAQLPWELEADKPVVSPTVKLQAPRSLDIDVAQQDGQVAAGVKIVINSTFVTIASGTTDSDGHVRLTIPQSAPVSFVLADAKKNGVDYVRFRAPNIPVSDPYQLAQDHSERIKLTLSPTRSLTVQVHDPNGKPIAGAQVYPWYFELPKKGGYANLGVLWAKETGLDGIVTYDNIPFENERELTIWARKEGYVARERLMIDTKTADPIVTSTLFPLVPVSGKVTYPDGTPAAGIPVLAGGGSLRMDDYRGDATTAEDGSFRLNVDPETFCMFVAGDNKRWASGVESRIVLHQPVDGIELKLQPATRVFGRLTAKGSDVPLANEYVSLYLKRAQDENDYYSWPKEKQLPNPEDSRKAVLPRIIKGAQTDKDGRFEFYTGPGAYYLIVQNRVDAPNFVIKDQPELEVNLQAERALAGTLEGRVVLATDPNQGVPEVLVFGYPLGNSLGNMIRATTNNEGRFQSKRSITGQLVGASTKDHKFGGIVRIDAGAETTVLPLGPTATLKGTLIAEETGGPAAGEEIGASIRVEDEGGAFMMAFQRSGTTDEAGRFEITGVIPGQKYDLHVVRERDADGGARSWGRVHEVEPKSAGVIALGELRLRRPNRPPTTEDYVARAFGKPEELASRFAQRLADGALTYQQVLLFVADRNSATTRRFFEARHDGDEANTALRRALANYLIIGVDATQADFLRKLEITTPNENDATIALVNTRGTLIVEAAVTQLETGGELDRRLLTEFLNTRNIPLPNAAEILTSALAKATREDKRVLVQVSGPDCAPCILLSRFLDRHEALIERDYVYLKLDSRMPSADEVIKKLQPTGGRGIPWTVILSAEGESLITSDSEKGNIGFPSEPEGKVHFEKMLRTTRKRLTDEEIQSLIADLDQ